MIGSDLVSRCEFGPGFVGAPVVVLSMSALHILMKTQDLSGLQLSHCRPLGQLHTETQQQHLLSLSARLLTPQSKYIYIYVKNHVISLVVGFCLHSFVHYSVTVKKSNE